FRILRKNRSSIIHAYSNCKLEWPKHFRENCLYAAAQGKRLRGIRLRKQQSKLIASDSKRGIRSTQSFFQSGSCCAQDFVAAQVAVLVVHFLEPVKIQNDQAERLAVAP